MRLEDLIATGILREAAARLLKLVASGHAFENDDEDTETVVTAVPTDMSLQVVRLTAQVSELQAQIVAMRVKEETFLCQICMECPIDTMILPCMHTMYCSTCLVDIGPCPTCRTPIRGKLECRLNA